MGFLGKPQKARLAMLEKMCAAWGVCGVSLYASLAAATTVLQFLTAVLAFVSGVIGFWLLLRKWRSDRKP